MVSRSLSRPKYPIRVVDDNRLIVQSTAIALGLMGHDLATACNVSQGMDRARTFHPDVILMDIGLPDINGHETVRRIQQPGARHYSDRRYGVWSRGRPAPLNRGGVDCRLPTLPSSRIRNLRSVLLTESRALSLAIRKVIEIPS
jgi:CheY-like chemotaxis protein